MRPTNYFLLCLFFASVLHSQAQESQGFSLEEAVAHAMKNNYELQQKQLDIEIAKAKVKETTAIGLPQINGEASMNYYMDIPTQLAEPFTIPELEGLPGFEEPDPDALQAFQFGLPWTASAGITASQLIFDGSYFVGLKAARAYKENAALGKEKSEIEVRNSVTQTYFSVVAMDETLESLKEDLATTTEMANDIRALFEAGFAEKQDADQVRLMRSNLRYQIEATERQRDQMLDLLKFQMGMPVDQDIELTSTMEQLVTATEDASGLLEQNLTLGNHIDYKLVTKGLELQELNLSSERTKYYPSLNAVFTHSQNGFAREFGELIDAPYKQYYPTTLVGVQLNVPIFSSGMRYHKNTQAKLEIQKTMSQRTQVEQNLKMQAEAARENYRSARERYELVKEDMELAESIKESTRLKFSEGLVSSQELNTAQSQYLQTLRNYINTTLELLNAKIALDKALGNG